MPCFAMLSFCSILISCSEHCYLMLFSGMSSNFTGLWSCYLLHFCQACLILLFCELAVAQCSSFVKHLLYITIICFVAMLECCRIVSWCILSAIMLLTADLCHSCSACHLQTVHLIPVIFISISTEIISSFQRHSWIAKLRPGSIFSSVARICIAYHIPHIMPCFASCCLRIAPWLIVYPFACVLALGRARRRVRDRGTCWVR